MTSASNIKSSSINRHFPRNNKHVIYRSGVVQTARAIMSL